MIAPIRYPASICISVDDEVVHGIPGPRRLKAGQLVTLDVAAEVGLGPNEILPYGRNKAKIAPEAVAKRTPKGRLVLVTGINPTPAGEGKSTVTIGVTQAADLLAYRQQCIDQVLSSDLGMSEDYVLRQINRQCSTPRRIAASPVVPVCIRVFVGGATPLARRVPGCKTV